MQSLDGRLVFSATDLNNYLECDHLVALERAVAEGRLERPEPSASLVLIGRKGIEHEAAYLARLRAEFPGLVEIAQDEPGRTGAERLAAIERAAAQTEAAMAAGAPVIYQGTFFDGTFLGKSDFLIRVERPCARWAWSYDVADTKLALHEKPYFIIQLAHYSEHVERVQGTAPLEMHLVLGDSQRRSFRVDDYAAYYRRLKARFLARGAQGDGYPLEVAHCTICRWSERCAARRFADDHLSLVAGMRNGQIAKLEASGVTTLAALAAPGSERPQAMNPDTFARLKRQAELQLRGRTSGPVYELLDHLPAMGFGIMPEPARGDVFFDIEGDPLYEIGTGLEYLFGCYCPDDEPAYRAFWGTDRKSEKAAFEACVDFLMERRRRYPTMHVYHYAPYEKTRFQQISQREGTREDAVDELLRSEVFVDLYAVVRQTLVISQSSYSIKKLEPYYAFRRSADVRKGDDSVVKFEEWLAQTERDPRILADIELYNQEDCASTWRLRDWLLERRREYAAARGIELPFRPLKAPEAPCHDPAAEGCPSCVRRERERAEEAKLSSTQLALAARTTDPLARRLSHLLSYHRREEKPAWWQYYARRDNLDELIEFDREAIGGLILDEDAPPERLKRSWVYTYRFPDQHYHLSGEVDDPATGLRAGEILTIDEDENRLRLKTTADLQTARGVHALIPGGPVLANEQKRALGRIGAAYLAGTLEADHRAALDLLAREIPHLGDRERGARIQPARVTPESVLAAVRALDRSYLIVQGPPGTGKTYTGARVIVQLLLSGARVGIMALGHKVMHNMLHAIEAYAHELGLEPERIRGVHKHSGSNAGSPYSSALARPFVVSEPNAPSIESGAYDLISGNGWLFAREGMTGRLDYLFIDEAGQMSLAEAIAVAPCARNVVLLGDPQQLSQVRQGSHRENAGDSVLEHLLRAQQRRDEEDPAHTIDPARGILLDVSYRMEPAICAFVSHMKYDGRLSADPPAANNLVRAGGQTLRGLRYLGVEHAGNVAESREEGEAIRAEVARLLEGTFVRKDEPEAPLTQRDILVVAPYNAQRRRIAAVLDAAGFGGVAVGTVDKFQGQEAPVVLYSMAASSAADVPRGLDFLFDPNRFNVAISRAQCVAMLVCSPRLLEARCTSVEQIAMVSTVCRFVECAATAQTETRNPNHAHPTSPVSYSAASAR